MASADRVALEALFRSTGGDNWESNTSWTTDAELSAWEGVTVGVDGRVKNLVLPENSLKGLIPEALGALTGVTGVSLGDNELTGPIPEALGDLTNLNELRLNSNQLMGLVPEVLGALTNLTLLDLDSNQLSGLVPEALGALTELKVINLGANELTGPIPEALGALTNLTELLLNMNQLTGSIPETLGALASLMELRLNNNQLEGPIPEALGALTTLSKICLGDNQLTDQIPDALGALTNLTELSLNNNQLTGPIPEALGALSSLTDFSLSDNHLTGHIPERLGALTNLTTLYLANNQLQGPIPEALGALTKLIHLGLSGNKLEGPIPEALGALTKLEYLYLNGNKFTGTVPLGIWKLPCTQYVGLSGNLLTHFTDPSEKTASTRVVVDCLERLERDSISYEFAGNPWQFPPAAVVANGRESVQRYYDTWKQCDFSLVENHALKVVFVGAYGAGKTSLARSIQLGRGDRTPEEDENSRTTVGVDLHSHKLRNGTECKIFDVAGQITYYGLHQFFLTERAVYVIVSDATKFEGLRGRDLDEAVEDNILEWVSLLHMRTPLCTVMLVASHFDKLSGSTHQDNERLLVTVEERFLALHEEWKSLRDYQSSSGDERMAILPGVFPVGCKLERESAVCTAEDGLRAVEEALSKQTSMVSLVPTSWVAARHVLEQVGGVHDGRPGEQAAVAGRRRPWELRSVIHNAFKTFVEEGRKCASHGGGAPHPASVFSQLNEAGIRDSMEGAIELRAFSGTVISHDVFVVLDVMWLARVLKPILDHRAITKNRRGRPVFADRVLGTNRLLRWATELKDGGILRHGFARFLWTLKEEVTECVDDSHEMDPAKFEEILDRLGVTIPLPLEESPDSSAPAADNIKPPEGGVDDGSRTDGSDLLVIMRLPLEADAETRDNLSLARKAALHSHDGDGGKNGLKAVFEFDHAGAPHGLPERVMALSHKIGVFSARARWRLGGLFLLHNNDVSGTTSMILEYDKKSRVFGIEALGQDAVHIRAVQFVISALYHVAHDFSGASWTAWMGCGMSHAGEKMYLLATSNEKQNLKPGSEIVPRTRDSPWDDGSKQRNLCGMQGLDARGSCSLDPDYFGWVLDVKQPFAIYGVDGARFGGLESRSTSPGSSGSLRWLCGDCDTLALGMSLDLVPSPRLGGELEKSGGLSPSPAAIRRPSVTTAKKLTELAQRIGRVEGGMNRVEGGVGRIEGGVGCVEGGIGRLEGGMDMVEGGMGRVERGMDRVEGGVDRVKGSINRVEGGMDRVEETVGRVEKDVGRVEECMHKLDEGMQAIARGIQDSLARLKSLQAPNYPYPHLVEVKERQANGNKRSLRNRLRGMFMVEMTLHFLCSFDMSRVPCGAGGNGYRLRKTRGWVKKISPALQVTIVTARVALKAVGGLEVPALSGFLQTVQGGLVDELVDRTLDEDALLSVLSGDDDAAVDMQRDARASYRAITEFMAKEEAERRTKVNKDGIRYVDFRDSMTEVEDGTGGLVWVRTVNVQKWRDSLPRAAPSR